MTYGKLPCHLRRLVGHVTIGTIANAYQLAYNTLGCTLLIVTIYLRRVVVHKASWCDTAVRHELVKGGEEVGGRKRGW